MKKLFLLTLTIFLMLGSQSQSQTRGSGQMVVPLGWENKSQIRFGMYGGGQLPTGWSDSMPHIYSNYQLGFGSYPFNAAPLSTADLGIGAYMEGGGIPGIHDLGTSCSSLPVKVCCHFCLLILH